jgi:hypothetical protein
MADHDDLVTLELAPLPREQTGPFILLGLDKTADQEAIEASWAQRVIWSRKKQYRIPLEDVNWAREVINDPLRRVRADVNSLNADTADLTLASLAGRAGAGGRKSPGWQPLDREKALGDYSPPVEVPALPDMIQAAQVPEPPRDMPAVVQLLEDWGRQPLDPWDLPVSFDADKGPTP